MPVKLSKKEVEELLAKKNPKKVKPAHFADEIEQLKNGEGLKITLEEWAQKSKVLLPTYYRSKYNERNGNDFLDIKKLGDVYVLTKNFDRKPKKRKA